MMNELINKIDRAIEEKELFYDTEKYDDEHYSWQIEGGVLDITYTEEV